MDERGGKKEPEEGERGGKEGRKEEEKGRREGEEKKEKVHFPSPSFHSQESCLNLKYDIHKNKADFFPSHPYRCRLAYLYKTYILQEEEPLPCSELLLTHTVSTVQWHAQVLNEKIKLLLSTLSLD